MADLRKRFPMASLRHTFPGGKEVAVWLDSADDYGMFLKIGNTKSGIPLQNVASLARFIAALSMRLKERLADIGVDVGKADEALKESESILREAAK